MRHLNLLFAIAVNHVAGTIPIKSDGNFFYMTADTAIMGYKVPGFQSFTMDLGK